MSICALNSPYEILEQCKPGRVYLGTQSRCVVGGGRARRKFPWLDFANGVPGDAEDGGSFARQVASLRARLVTPAQCIVEPDTSR